MSLENSKNHLKSPPKMMEFFKKATTIDFAGMYGYMAGLSLLLAIISIFLIASGRLKYGVDFRGGAEVQVKFNKAIELSDLRKALSSSGYSEASVQSIGSESEHEFLVKVSADEKNLNAVSQAISNVLTSKFTDSGVEIRKTDIVGPKAGAELRFSAFKAMIYSLLAIMVYVGLRFDFKYAPGAMVSLLHDALLTIGLLAVTGNEFTLQSVAAILAIIGYSINDTVVIYDRVREHEEHSPGTPMKDLINRSINETMSRTILTSGATLMTCLCMLFLGGPVIRDFFITMTFGIVIGSYSSVFVAVPMTIMFDKPTKKVATSDTAAPSAKIST